MTTTLLTIYLSVAGLVFAARMLQHIGMRESIFNDETLLQGLGASLTIGLAWPILLAAKIIL